MIFNNVFIHSIASVTGHRLEINSDRDFSVTGIKHRYVCQTTAGDLALEALSRLLTLNEGKFHLRNIYGKKAFVLVTQTPDLKIPSTAFKVQNEAGMNCDICFDINAGCSGWVTGLQQAVALIESRVVDSVFLLTADALASNVESSKTLSPIFSDAATATFLTRCNIGTSQIRFDSGTIPAGINAISCSHGASVEMNGLEVYDFAKSKAPDSVFQVMGDAFGDLTQKQSTIEIYLHQASKLINQSVEREIRAKLSSPCFKEVELNFPSSLHDCGNTTSSSIPLTISSNFKESDAKAFNSFVASGFGTGLSYASTSWVQRIPINVIPLIRADIRADEFRGEWK